jgi:predicted small lipoprotein YifL
MKRGLRVLPVWPALLLLAACGSAPPAPPAAKATPPLPLTVGGGKGSQRGNYPTVVTGEIHDSPDGPCAVYAWDRMLSSGQVIRYLSAACPYPGRPGFFRMVELGRVLLPAGESPLAAE